MCRGGVPGCAPSSEAPSALSRVDGTGAAGREGQPTKRTQGPHGAWCPPHAAGMGVLGGQSFMSNWSQGLPASEPFPAAPPLTPTPTCVLPVPCGLAQPWTPFGSGHHWPFPRTCSGEGWGCGEEAALPEGTGGTCQSLGLWPAAGSGRNRRGGRQGTGRGHQDSQREWGVGRGGRGEGAGPGEGTSRGGTSGS